MSDYVNQGALNENSPPLESTGDARLTPLAPRQTTENVYDEVDHIDYRFEEARLNSFKNWPVTSIKPEILAASGFYYTGEGDKVKCFECETEICKWVESDDPMGQHQRWSGRCRFIRKISCGNVPIGTDPENVPPPSPRGADVRGLYDLVVKDQSTPDCQTFPTRSEMLNAFALSCSEIARLKEPFHCEFITFVARFNSFEAWPKSMSQIKTQLANAGFFYTGKSDQTICFYCGNTLKDWMSEDDPWEKHAKWFPKCYYVLMVIGEKYGNKITDQHAASSSKEESELSASYIKKLQDPLNTNSETSHCSQDSDIKSPGCSLRGSRIIDDTCSKTISQSMNDAILCKICRNARLGVLFVPCGHLVACVRCAPSLTTCAMCRGPINKTVRAFI